MEKIDNLKEIIETIIKIEILIAFTKDITELKLTHKLAKEFKKSYIKMKEGDLIGRI